MGLPKSAPASTSRAMRFFEPSRSATLTELAERLNGRVVRGGDTVVRDICHLGNAAADAIGYVASVRALRGLDELPPILIATEDVLGSLDAVPAVMVHEAPQTAFAAVGRYLYDLEGPRRYGGDVHPTANIHETASLEDGVRIGANATIEEGVQVGWGTYIGAGAVITRDCRIGRDCDIGPNVTLTASLLGDRVEVQANSVIGEPGFGYVPGPTGVERVVQVGRVIVQDDVHIGSTVCIDRGSIGDTVIGEGTKVGNMQQIAHNTRIGRHCIVVGNGGIAGSVTIGDGVTIAGGVFVLDHSTIGSGATIAGITMVRGTVPPGVTWGGIPARPVEDYLRDMAEISARSKRRARGKGNVA